MSTRAASRFGRMVAGGTLLLGLVSALAAGRAEYAVRWDPAEGGPASVDAVLDALGQPGGQTRSWAVRYGEVRGPGDLPADWSIIGRERRNDRKATATLKWRGPEPRPAGLAGWSCPLIGKADAKEEVDITWLAPGQVRRSLSLSCTVDDAPLQQALPPGYRVESVGCAATLDRVKTGRLTVERWALADGSVVLEVSRSAEDRLDIRARFESDVAQPLSRLGVRPMATSKTERVSHCR